MYPTKRLAFLASLKLDAQAARLRFEVEREKDAVRPCEADIKTDTKICEKKTKNGERARPESVCACGVGWGTEGQEHEGRHCF
jgi:hypothetical protein